MNHIVSKGINAPIQQYNGTVLFGENNTKNTSVKMHKFMHERLSWEYTKVVIYKSTMLYMFISIVMLTLIGFTRY